MATPPKQIVPSQPQVETRATWSGPWQPQTPLLQAQDAVSTVQPTIPTASFLWSYGEIDSGHADGFEEIAPAQLIGHYARLNAPHMDPTTGKWTDRPIWHGIITGQAIARGGDETTYITGDQILTALGLEVLLDRAAVAGSQIRSGDEAVLIDTVLAFNRPRADGLGVLGNRSALEYSTGRKAGVQTAYIFSEATGDAKLWTLQDVIEYLLGWFGPADLDLALAGATANAAAMTEVYDPAPTIRGCLNELIDRRRGHTWRITVDDTGDKAAKVTLYSVLAAPVTVGGSTVAASTAKVTLEHSDADRGALVAMKTLETIDAIYDRIDVRGSPILLMGTLRVFAPDAGDITLEKAWGAAAEAAYIAEGDAEGRAADKYAGVYRAFRAKLANLPGGPTCNDSGVLDATTPAAQYHHGKTFLRQLPILETATAEDATAPRDYRRPFAAAVWDDEGTDKTLRLDAAAEANDGGGANISLRLFDSELGFTLGASPNYILGLNHYTGANDNGIPPFLDYATLLATLAWHSDERLRVAMNIPGPHRPSAMRTLTIDVPDAQCWYQLADTVVDVQNAAEVWAAGAGAAVELRNDRARLAAICALASAWYQDRRRAVELTWATLKYDRTPGDLLTSVITAQEVEYANSLQTRIAWDFRSAITTMETGFLELDFVRAIGKGNPVGGGGGARGIRGPMGARGPLGQPGLPSKSTAIPAREALPTPLPPGSGQLFGKAKQNWEDDIVGVIVVVYPCDDAGGTNPHTGIEHTVFFPYSDMYHPNVRTDDVIGYFESGGSYVANWNENYQLRVGARMMWHNTDAIPVGWQLADGTNDTLDMAGCFVVGYGDGDADFGVMDATGGARSSPVTGRSTGTVCAGTGAVSTFVTTNDTPVVATLPPFIVQAWIERVS